MPYDPGTIEAYFDTFAEREWQRFDQSPLGAIHEHIHNLFLERHVPRGARVLEVGAGPGRFTQRLHELGCRIVVVDLSRVQLDLNRKYGAERGFAQSVERYEKMDVCDLSGIADGSVDVVVAFGGPLSYVFERRDDAVASCRRVLRSGGVLLASVMSLWGAIHRHLAALRDLPVWSMMDILATGDLTAENDPTSSHKCHMYRSEEFVALLERHHFIIQALSASNAVSTNLDPLLTELREQPDRWQALLDIEAQAAARPGFVDGGTHLIAAAVAS